MALFDGAKHVNVYGGSFVASTVNSPKPALDKLVAEVAPNAILNAGGRADEVRCFPGTREEVIGKLEEFMDDNSVGRKRMMWLSGPAGAGKSSICQTVAERRSEQGRQAANFFFFRGDSTRSHSKPLVATLVYQLRHFYPALDELLANCLAKDPLICGTSIEKQFNQLILSPVQTIQRSTPIQEQIVIIVDGLDECNNETRDQDQILVALHTLAHADHSPFRILVSSRAEPHLVMSFNRLGSSVASIFLNDDYQPQKDIRLFVVAKFAEIKKDHHLAQTLSLAWPPDVDIDAIVDKSSGQFIYAATVMRYIQFSPSSPALSLVKIIEMAPSTSHNPLAHLDAIYSYIFSKVHNIQAIKFILFARQCSSPEISSARTFRAIVQLAGYKDIEVQSLFADLAAVIKVHVGNGLTVDSHLLEFYHASLEDYLTNKSRSTIYCVNENETAADLSSICWRNIHDPDSFQVTLKPFCKVQQPTPELFNSLLDASTKQIGCYKDVILFLDDLIYHIEQLYWEYDKAQFKALLQSWSRFVRNNNLDSRYWGKIRAKNPQASQYYKQYWMTSYYGGHSLPTLHDSVPASSVASSNTQVSHVMASTKLRVSPGNTVTPAAPSKGGRGSLGREVAHHRSSGTSGAISTHREEEEGHRSGEYVNDASPSKLSKIRIKLHYQGDIRSMSLTPDTPFSEFVNKVTTKFGKNFNDLTVKFKDEDGDEITLRDDSDYEHAIETACKSSKGKAEGVLRIWCQERA